MMAYLKPGDVIENFNDMKSEEFISWTFGGFLSEQTFVIHQIDEDHRTPYYFQLKKGWVYTLPGSEDERDFIIPMLFEVKSASVEYNLIELLLTKEE